MRSIVQKDSTKCFLCGEPEHYKNGMYDRLEEHHIFFGTANRKKSEKWGMKVYLHGVECHRCGNKAVHKNRNVDLKLKQMAQMRFEQIQGSRELFRKEFGKSWL